MMESSEQIVEGCEKHLLAFTWQPSLQALIKGMERHTNCKHKLVRVVIGDHTAEGQHLTSISALEHDK